MRKFQFQNNYYYHIYNRGVDKRKIFIDKNDYVRFICSMRNFNNDSKHEQRIHLNNISKSLELSSEASELSSLILNLPKYIDIISYCLNPNHYHFFIKQNIENGIEKFMHKINLGYTNYFNKKNNRSGSLLQGTYKAVKVSNYSHFLKLAVYVNCNSEIHGICSANKWPWSSYFDYIDKRNGTLCNKQIVMDEFKNATEFKNFCIEIIPNMIKIKELKQYILE